MRMVHLQYNNDLSFELSDRKLWTQTLCESYANYFWLEMGMQKWLNVEGAVYLLYSKWVSSVFTLTAWTLDVGLCEKSSVSSWCSAGRHSSQTPLINTTGLDHSFMKHSEFIWSIGARVTISGFQIKVLHHITSLQSSIHLYIPTGKSVKAFIDFQ